jgi:hypothetical protein
MHAATQTGRAVRFHARLIERRCMTGGIRLLASLHCSGASRAVQQRNESYLRRDRRESCWQIPVAITPTSDFRRVMGPPAWWYLRSGKQRLVRSKTRPRRELRYRNFGREPEEHAACH